MSTERVPAEQFRVFSDDDEMEMVFEVIADEDDGTIHVFAASLSREDAEALRDFLDEKLG